MEDETVWYEVRYVTGPILVGVRHEQLADAREDYSAKRGVRGLNGLHVVRVRATEGGFVDWRLTEADLNAV